MVNLLDLVQMLKMKNISIAFNTHKNILDKWLSSKITLVINEIGIKFTKNKILCDFLEKYTFLCGTSLNISGKPPLYGKKLKIFIKKLKLESNILDRIEDYSNKDNKSSEILIL